MTHKTTAFGIGNPQTIDYLIRDSICKGDSPMHTRLSLRTHCAFAGLWATALAACFAIGQAPVLLLVSFFSALGLAIGTFQSLAMRSSPAAFLVATSASAVKMAFMSSKVGKLSIAAMWPSVVAIVWLVWFKPEWASPQTLLGSYAAMLLCRELASFPGVLLLSRIRRAT